MPVITDLLGRMEHLGKAAEQLALDVGDINDDGKISWDDLLAAGKDQKFADLVELFLGQTKRQQVYEALAELDAKKKKLARGRSYVDMSIEELTQYGALRKAERMLFAAADKIEHDRSAFVQWLVDDALPVLAKIGKTVLKAFV